MTMTINDVRFSVYYVHNADTNLGYIERYVLPTGEIVRFNEDGTDAAPGMPNGKINLELMRPHIGKMFHFYRNGVLQGAYELKDIAPTKAGIMAMHYDVETGEGDEEESRI